MGTDCSFSFPSPSTSISTALNVGWRRPFLGDKTNLKSRPRALNPTSRILLNLWVLKSRWNTWREHIPRIWKYIFSVPGRIRAPLDYLMREIRGRQDLEMGQVLVERGRRFEPMADFSQQPNLEQKQGNPTKRSSHPETPRETWRGHFSNGSRFFETDNSFCYEGSSVTALLKIDLSSGLT